MSCMEKVTLKQSQNWLMSLLIERGNLKQKVFLSNQTHDVSAKTLFTPNKAGELPGLEIYASSYVLRLLECLKKEYKYLEKFMGQEVFELFAKAFIVHRPSKSYSLYELGKNFSDFLETTKPRVDNNKLNSNQIELPIEIAKYERCVHEVSLARSGKADELMSYTYYLTLFNFSQAVKLKASESLRLLHFKYPIPKLIKKISQNEAFTFPTQSESWLAISSVNYQLIETSLARWQCIFLQRLIEGDTTEEAISFTSSLCKLSKSDVKTSLIFWLHSAIGGGLIVIQ